VSAQDIFGFVVVKELFHAVRAEFHNIARAVRVTDKVRLDSQLLIVVRGVAPQDVYDQLLLRGRDLMNDLKRSLDHFDLFD
jgi:hypothetical protein